MTFTKAKSVGWVNDRDNITSGELEHMDAILPDAIDGASGGTWAPSAPIIINGQGMQISPLEDSVLTGALLLSGDDCHVRWRLDNTTMNDAACAANTYVVRTSNDEWHTVTGWTGNAQIWLARTTGLPLPLAGDRIRIRHIQAANRILNLWENDGGGVQVATMTPGVGPDNCWVDVTFDGTNWFCSAWGADGAASVTVLQ